LHALVRPGAPAFWAAGHNVSPISFAYEVGIESLFCGALSCKNQSGKAKGGTNEDNDLPGSGV